MARKNDIRMYSTHNEEKSVITRRFIKTLKNKIYKSMTLISKNVYIDKLDDIANKNDNTSEASPSKFLRRSFVKSWTSYPRPKFA